MSDTPRTDVLIPKDDEIESNAQEYVDLCRQLERELAAMTRERDAVRHDREMMNKEILRLDAEVERLRQEIQDRKDHAAGYEIYVDQVKRENERLRALLTEAEHENIELRCRNTSQVIAEWRNENDKLRALLREIVGWRDMTPDEYDRCMERIRAALGEE